MFKDHHTFFHELWDRATFLATLWVKAHAHYHNISILALHCSWVLLFVAHRTVSLCYEFFFFFFLWFFREEPLFFSYTLYLSSFFLINLLSSKKYSGKLFNVISFLYRSSPILYNFLFIVSLFLIWDSYNWVSIFSLVVAMGLGTWLRIWIIWNWKYRYFVVNKTSISWSLTMCLCSLQCLSWKLWYTWKIFSSVPC